MTKACGALLLLLLAAACGPAPTQPTNSPGLDSPTDVPSTDAPPASVSPTVSPTSEGGDPVGTLVLRLEAEGPSVRDLGTFPPAPLGGQGVHLCVSGQRLNVYV